MAEFVIHFGGYSAQGRRPNNEDRYVADPNRHVFLVADGMGGQEFGERASGLAAEIIPREVEHRLAAHEDPNQAVQQAIAVANQAIIDASQSQAAGRRMGTTAVLAVQQANQFFVAGVGDSRAYLIRGGQVEQLTIDHTVADALQRNGTITADQAKNSPWRNVLYRFLGCTEMTEGAEVRPFAPQAGDRLILASDGLTNHISDEDLRDGAARYHRPEQWAEVLVQLALERGSRDNVTCVVVAFDAE
jgi:protein phosphatase